MNWYANKYTVPGLSVVLLLPFFIGLAPTATADQSEDLAALVRSQLYAASTRSDFLGQGVYLAEPERVSTFYRVRDFMPVWRQAGQWRPQVQELLEVIRKAHREGLDANNYHVRQIEELVTRTQNKVDGVLLAQADIVFTDALLGYVSDLHQGRLRHSPIRKGVKSDSAELDINQFVSLALSDGLPNALSKLTPESLAYARLRAALLTHRTLSDKESTFSKPERLLRKGDTGSDVNALSRRLLFLGDLHDIQGNGERFDDVIERAVLRFQTRHGLEPDGIVGPKTNAALAVPMVHRVSQIKFNLERWRWLPQTLGQRYVVINIAAFALEIIENDDLVLGMRAIVGRPFQQTPVFSSNIVYVILNPYWEVPHSIATKEILPKLRQDPDYLAREHMRVLQDIEGKIQKVDPATIDWNAVSREQFPYRLRQDPGPANALGRIKFYLPNRYSVYLHDTPHKSLFSQAVRCFSHGCIRLEQPFDLAAYLLGDQTNWTKRQIIETLDREQNYRIMLTTPVPIYVVYWTAWVDSHGTIHFRDDVYGRDQRLNLLLEQLNSKTPR